MPRADAKLKNLPEDLQAEMWRLRTSPVDALGESANPGDGSPWTQEAVRAWLATAHGVESSAGSFSEWERWYALAQRMERAKARAAQATAEAASDPNFSSEDLQRLGQDVFTAETIEDGNIKAFVELQRLRIKARALDHDERRIKLLEDNAARAKEQLTAVVKDSKGGLTPETLKRIEEAANLL